jgi:histone-lysine N-methyltransferase SUV420H
MNMSDLSRDDDFLSHLFVEKLGTGNVPLFVHKMDSSRRLPKTDATDVLQIIRRVRSFPPLTTLTLRSNSHEHKVGCVEGPAFCGNPRSGWRPVPVRPLRQLQIASWLSYLSLHRLRPISYYLFDYTDKQTNAFATYASRAKLEQLEP